MRLLRLTLDDWCRFRGAGHVFDLDADASVVAGPNEAGKSTLFAAIRRALFDRARTSSPWAGRLAPYGAVGSTPRVTLELEHHGRRLRIVKTFGRRGAAELAERRGGAWKVIARQDEATERLLAMLKAEQPKRGPSTPAHWGAFQWLFMPQDERQLPSGETDAVSRLGLEHTGVSADYDRVLQAARRERDLWVTRKTGRIARASELARLDDELELLREKKRALDGELAALDEQRWRLETIESHDIPRLREELRGAIARWQEVSREVEDFTATEHELAKLCEKLAHQRKEAEQRRQIVEHRDRREAEAGAARQAHNEAVQAHATAAAEAEALARARGELARSLAAAAREVAERRRVHEEACEALTLARTRRELDETRRRLGWAKELEAAITALEERLTGAAAGRETIEEIEKIERELELKRHDLTQSRLRLTVQGGGGFDVLADGEPLSDGQSHALDRVEVRMRDGSGSVVVEGRGTARELERAAARLEDELARRLAPFGVDSVAALRERAEQRRLDEQKIGSTRDERAAVDERPVAELAEAVERLEQQVAALAEKRPPTEGATDLATGALEDEVEEARRELGDAELALEEIRTRHERIDPETRAGQERLRAAEAACQRTSAVLGKADDELERDRDEHGSLERCHTAWTCAKAALTDTEAREEQVRRKLDTLRARDQTRKSEALARREEVLDKLRRAELERDGLVRKLESETLGGAWSKLADLERQIESETRRRRRLSIRARAAQHLEELLTDVQREAIDRVVEPVKSELDDYLGEVTGGRYTLARLDQNLQPLALSGGDDRRCELEDGSQGLKELVATLIRLAVAVKLSAGEPQTVILDDPCVHVSHERSGRLVHLMNRLLSEHRLQIILMTHRPGEFAALSASVLDLSEAVTAPGGP